MRPSLETITLGLMSLPLLVACDPPPENVGKGLGTDGATSTADGDGGADETAGADAPGAVQWLHLFPVEDTAARVTPMPDGGAVVTTHSLDAEQNDQVLRFSADGSVLWQVAPGSHVFDVETLPDGRLVLGGSLYDDDPMVSAERATLWRLSSAGAVEATYAHPYPGGDTNGAWITKISASLDGVAFLVSNWGPDLPPGTAYDELWWSDFDLVPQWSWTEFEGSPEDVMRLPSGELRTAEGVDDEMVQHTLVRGFSPDGMPLAPVVLPVGRFADDAPLVHYWVDGSGIGAESLDGPPILEFFDTAEYGFNGGVAAAYGPSLGIAATVDDGSFAALQLDPAGDLVREQFIAPPSLDIAAPLDVAIVPDGSMIVVGFTVDPAGPTQMQGFVMKLSPP